MNFISKFISCKVLVIFYLNICQYSSFVQCSNFIFNKSLNWIIYSPYTSAYNRSRLPPVIIKAKDDYTVQDLKTQLLAVRRNFTTVVTLGMGVSEGTIDSSWNETASECLISTAAAELNSQTLDSQLHIKLFQGIRISDNRDVTVKEIENARKAVDFANSISSDSVQSILLNVESRRMSVLNESLQTFKSYFLNYPFGIRLSYKLCNATLSSKRTVSHLNASFIICRLIKSTISQNELEKDILLCEQIIATGRHSDANVICEFSGATTKLSQPISINTSSSTLRIVKDFLQYWEYVEKWSASSIPPQKIVINEAFDQPGRCDIYRDPKPVCHRGIWLPVGNDNYVFKFFNSIEDSKTQPSDSGSTNILAIIGIVSLSLVGFVAIFVGILLWKRKVAQDLQKQYLLSNKDYEEFLYGISNSFNEDNEAIIPFRLPYNRDLELPVSSFKIETNQILGAGNFGTVFLGYLKDTNTRAAFKTINHTIPDNLKNFLAELKIISYIGRHPNIVCLLGAYTKEVQKGIIYIVLEYCGNGSLQNFLRKHSSSTPNQTGTTRRTSSGDYQSFGDIRYCNDPTTGYVNLMLETPKSKLLTHIDVSQLFRWAYELTSAMAWLEIKKVIHGDLATRNILLNSNNESKLTDFGLSRRLYEYTDYIRTSKDPLPWRWMAPESLTQMNFSTKSDVWSYGVTLWEIFTLGDIPYPGLNYTTEFPQLLEGGLRLLKPELASEELFTLMDSCWESYAEDRPSFCEILERFPSKDYSHDYSNTSEAIREPNE